MWRKSIYADPIPLNTKNDRICAVEVSLSNPHLNKLVIYNIYCPSSDADHDHFSQCIIDLEAEINSHDNEATTIIILQVTSMPILALLLAPEAQVLQIEGELPLKSLLTEITYLYPLTHKCQLAPRIPFILVALSRP